MFLLHVATPPRSARQAIRRVKCWRSRPSRGVTSNGRFRTIYHVFCLREIEFSPICFSVDGYYFPWLNSSIFIQISLTYCNFNLVFIVISFLGSQVYSFKRENLNFVQYAQSKIKIAIENWIGEFGHYPFGFKLSEISDVIMNWFVFNYMRINCSRYRSTFTKSKLQSGACVKCSKWCCPKLHTCVLNWGAVDVRSGVRML